MPFTSFAQAQAEPGLTVILFGGEWNPTTRALSGALGQGLPAGARFLEVDIDQDPAAPAAAGLRCIPSLQIRRDGALIATRELAVPGEALTAWLAGQL